MKLFKKIISFEPLIIWLRYFLTLKIQNILINFLTPIGLCITLFFTSKETIIKADFDVFSISSILVGFCSSILIMLFTIDGINIKKLKETKLSNVSISIHQALIYKFSFIVINLLVLIIVALIALFVGFDNNIFYKLYALLILTNTILTLLEALTNTTFCLIGTSKKQQ